MPYHTSLPITNNENDQEIFFTAVKQLSMAVNFSSINNTGEVLQKLTFPASFHSGTLASMQDPGRRDFITQPAADAQPVYLPKSFLN